MPGRNDPCPCGSGKKYKLCCAAKDEARARTARRLHLADDTAAVPRLMLPPGAVLSDPWEVAVVPMMAQLADDPAARPVGILVVANELIVHADILARGPAEPADLAQHLERVVLEAIDGSGWRPTQVHVRHEDVAAHLAPRLAPHGITVTAARELPQADRAARALTADFLGQSVGGAPMSYPSTWAGWGLPRDLVGTLFSHAAAFYRAAPWRLLFNEDVLRAEVPGSGTWWLIVLGQGGEEFGIALYSSAEDVERTFSTPDPDLAYGHASGAMISLTFDTRDDLPPATRREIREAKWEIAGAAAYPQLVVLNTPGGGITQPQVRDLIACLDAVPNFVAAHQDFLEIEGTASRPLPWTDEASGVVLELFDVGYEDVGPWERPEHYATSGPEGPGARPGEWLADMSAAEREAIVNETCARFEAWLQHAGKKPLSRTTARRHARTIAPFLLVLVSLTHRSLAAVTEFDLRDYLYRVYPDPMLAGAAAPRSVLGSLRRFFEYLEQSKGVRCPWADDILHDTAMLELRLTSRPSGAADDPRMAEWVGVLSADLDARLLLPAFDPEAEVEWSDVPGPVESKLYDELQRLWLVWRDEAVRAGYTDHDALLAATLERQREWMRAANPLAGGKSPAQAMAREQRRRATQPSPRSDTKTGHDEPMTLLDAYRADSALEHGVGADKEASLWLLLGHSLGHIAHPLSGDRQEMLHRVSQAFRPVPDEHRTGRRGESWPEAARLGDLFEAALAPEGVDPLFERCLEVTREASAAGGHRTSEVILRSLREAFPSASHTLHARAIGQQAEIADRLGLRVEAERLRLEAEIVAGL